MEELIRLLMQLRTAAIHQPGYITGETLVSTEDPSIITVLSTWRSLDDWKTWEKEEARVKMYWQIEPLLKERARISVYQIMTAEPKG
ncbi:hypothetical protein ES703_113573 [subsurface metagenome]